jgi:hypothetical protein
MSGDPKECRKRAERCIELAAEASGESRAHFLGLSKNWEKLAMEFERTGNAINRDRNDGGGQY